jgi:hypothetical protein
MNMLLKAVGGASHILNVGAILGDKISQFHLLDGLGKLQHLSTIVAAQCHNKLVEMMRHLLAAGLNCAGECWSLTTWEQLSRHQRTFNIELVQPTLEFRWCLEQMRWIAKRYWFKSCVRTSETSETRAAFGLTMAFTYSSREMKVTKRRWQIAWTKEL